MASWTLNDIPWHLFEPDKVEPRFVSLAKAAAMVEYNGHDYARYLCEVFRDDAPFQIIANQWAQEEVQHGQALRRWAELADPAFDFDACFKAFTEGYSLPKQVDASVRGSCTGELIARCVVEVGTSAYYTAMKEATNEPVLQAICAKIAADEFKHYKLFYTHMHDYLAREKLGFFSRAKIAISRVLESEDDELAYAFFAAHDYQRNLPYDRKIYMKRYLSYAYPLYQPWHIQRMTRMVWKAIGGKRGSFFERLLNAAAWRIISARGRAQPALAA